MQYCYNKYTNNEIHPPSINNSSLGKVRVLAEEAEGDEHFIAVLLEYGA
jgi:hypothetical protein